MSKCFPVFGVCVAHSQCLILQNLGCLNSSILIQYLGSVEYCAKEATVDSMPVSFYSEDFPVASTGVSELSDNI